MQNAFTFLYSNMPLKEHVQVSILSLMPRLNVLLYFFYIFYRYDLLHNSHLNLGGLNELFKVAQVQTWVTSSEKETAPIHKPLRPTPKFDFLCSNTSLGYESVFSNIPEILCFNYKGFAMFSIELSWLTSKRKYNRFWVSATRRWCYSKWIRDKSKAEIKDWIKGKNFLHSEPGPFLGLSLFVVSRMISHVILFLPIFREREVT